MNYKYDNDRTIIIITVILNGYSKPLDKVTIN